MRVGWGADAHRFSEEGKVLLAGVVVDRSRGVAATSDGDVLAHAVADALLGAAALGDLGALFPSSDRRWEGADSMRLLAEVVSRVRAQGLAVSAVDATVIAEEVPVATHRHQVRASLARVLGVDEGMVSVKATSTDGMGFTGRSEGIAAVAVVVLGEEPSGGG